MIRSLPRRAFIAAAAIALLAGCATTQERNAAPVAVDIPGASRKAVLDVLVAELTASGAELKSINEYVAVFDKPDDTILAAMLFGSRYNAKPNMRLTFTTTPYSTGTRVQARAAMVTNPGSAHERATEMTAQNIRRDLSGLLDRLRIRLAQK